jgi:hypothetical protein
MKYVMSAEKSEFFFSLQWKDAPKEMYGKPVKYVKSTGKVLLMCGSLVAHVLLMCC